MDDPVVSIIIPVGPDRDNIIVGTLQSLLNTTQVRDAVEILLKLDFGDIGSLKAVTPYLSILPIRIIYMDGSRRGADLDKYANRLSSEAKGKFIWYWTDEVRMITPEWEKTFIGNIHVAQTFAVIFPQRKNMIGDIYPCITRKWLDTTGRFCGHIAHDCWTHEIAKALPEKVSYQTWNNIEMKNSTFCKENPEYPHFATVDDFNSEAVQNELKKDIEKIRTAV